MAYFRIALIRLLLCFFIASPICAKDEAFPNAVGDWHGTLSIGQAQLRLSIHFVETETDELSGHLVSLDQSPAPIPLTDIIIADQTLSFNIPSIGGRFVAHWNREDRSWTGNWIQNGEFPLTLYQGGPAKQTRPQEPEPPYPYQTDEVLIEVAPGVRLAGTLTLPNIREPFPVVVLVTGSGAQNRDEEVFGHRPFLVLADFLTRRGIAVLRLDDRGTGSSSGDFAKSTMIDFAKDLAGIVAWLRSDPRVDRKKIGLLGHSEGGLVASMVAAENPKIRFVVLLSSPGLRGLEVLVSQTEAIGRVTGASDDAIALNVALIEKINVAINSSENTEQASKNVGKVMADAGMEAKAISEQIPTVTSPWYLHFTGFDPKKTLERIRQPLLMINGANDTQVVARLNVPALRTATSKNKGATILELPNLNHLLQSSQSGDPRDYAKIDETIAPEALKLIADWIESKL